MKELIFVNGMHSAGAKTLYDEILKEQMRGGSISKISLNGTEIPEAYKIKRGTEITGGIEIGEYFSTKLRADPERVKDFNWRALELDMIEFILDNFSDVNRMVIKYKAAALWKDPVSGQTCYAQGLSDSSIKMLQENFVGTEGITKEFIVITGPTYIEYMIKNNEINATSKYPFGQLAAMTIEMDFSFKIYNSIKGNKEIVPYALLAPKNNEIVLVALPEDTFKNYLEPPPWSYGTGLKILGDRAVFDPETSFLY